MSLEPMPKRITNSKGWTIAIDDGFVSFKYCPDLTGGISINDVFLKIERALGYPNNKTPAATSELQEIIDEVSEDIKGGS